MTEKKPCLLPNYNKMDKKPENGPPRWCMFHESHSDQPLQVKNTQKPQEVKSHS